MNVGGSKLPFSEALSFLTFCIYTHSSHHMRMTSSLSIFSFYYTSRILPPHTHSSFLLTARVQYIVSAEGLHFTAFHYNLILFILVELSALYVSLPRDVIASAIIGNVAINYEKEIRRKVLTWLSSSERWVGILADKHNREFTLLLLVHAIRLKGELPTTITQTIEIPRMSYDSQLAVECFTNYH